ncbi:ferredoxin [Desulfosporosinus youngiae]|uniref:Ferredoxin n=1 Tax=Desulfosporosinus youngiae DSM 17734 TaxID=768710 RepID=H5XX15_9FIRM|nr:ferredoxin [Desulfosporosinus youngiae]EHQ90883.1 ferredoxin [Desulfosporosinus youngiae DSM 17734]
MFATVNSDCIGCGACEAICPQVFRMNSYEIAEAYLNPIPQDVEEATKLAAKSCPVAAIILEG